jgi:hypothetical protein
MPPRSPSPADQRGRSDNVPGHTTAKQRLDEALAEYKRRCRGVAPESFR